MTTPKEPFIHVPPPGPKARAIVERDRKVTSPSYIKEYPLVVERGEGPWVYDVDGNCFLDFMAGIAVASTGHAHPAVVRAIREAADKFLHICGTDFYYESFAALCERLAGYLRRGAQARPCAHAAAPYHRFQRRLSRPHLRRDLAQFLQGRAARLFWAAGTGGDSPSVPFGAGARRRRRS
jgi:4-aminobutyrate aminotransferase